ncbi:MAG TPA: hypothetical protein VGE04_15695, partial [Chloroflexia bacterium]
TRLFEIEDVTAAPLELKALDATEIGSLLRAAGGPAATLAEHLDFTTKVHEVSLGDPFYLHFLVQDIQDGLITPENIADHPNGLDKYLENWWTQLTNDIDITTPELYDLLGILSVAKGRLLPKDFGDISSQLRRGGLLKRELSGKLRRYLVGDQQRGYAIAHARLGKYLVEQQFESEVQEYRRQVLDFCSRWQQHRSAYALTYYAQHLVEAIERSDRPERSEHTQRLVDVTGDPAFQQAHIDVLNDLLALQADLLRSLNGAVANQGQQTIRLVVKSALALENFRTRELRPEAVFELMRQQNLEAARSRLALFDVEPGWQQAALLAIAWLAGVHDIASARTLLQEVQPGRPHGEPLGTLWDWVNADLNNTAPPQPALERLPAIQEVRVAVERMKGSGDVELLGSAAAGGLPPAAELQGEQGYLAREDGPLLVAFAFAQPQEGNEYFDQYVAMHTGYSYTYYRQRSLWLLLDAVVRHPSAEWVRGAVEKLVVSALAGSRSDFREALPITIRALQARQTGRAQELDTYIGMALARAEELTWGGRGTGDVTGEHKRRLAAIAEALARLLDRQAGTHQLLDRAINLPYGFAGYGAPAYLSLAESMLISGPTATPPYQDALEHALNAAHNIQDETFCARSTARVNAMRLFWWKPGGVDDLQGTITRLHHDPSQPEFATLHFIGERYDRRADIGKLPLSPQMRGANTLQALADVHQRPLTEFQRVNRAQNWADDQVLADGTAVLVPDPGFATWLAARFAATALVEPSLMPLEAQRLIQLLVPVASNNPTTLDTVLARLLLADPATDQQTLDELQRLV